LRASCGQRALRSSDEVVWPVTLPADLLVTLGEDHKTGGSRKGSFELFHFRKDSGNLLRVAEESGWCLHVSGKNSRLPVSVLIPPPESLFPSIAVPSWTNKRY
jgi:hypothetical protein